MKHVIHKVRTLYTSYRKCISMYYLFVCFVLITVHADPDECIAMNQTLNCISQETVKVRKFKKNSSNSIFRYRNTIMHTHVYRNN